MPHKSPVTREVDSDLRERCNLLAKKVGINHTKFWDSALKMYCDYIENNPPPVEKHTRQKFQKLIDDSESMVRAMDDMQIRINILEGQVVEMHKNGTSIAD